MSPELASNYFDIRTYISQSDNESWIGRIRSYRKDTGENWYYGKTIITQNRQELDSQLLEEKSKLYSLLEIPYDWEHKSRKILVRYLKLTEKITKFSLTFLSGNMVDKETTGELKDKYFELCNFLVNESILIVSEINSLSEEDRYELILSKGHIFDKPTDPWNLDDLSGRSEIFKFILNPNEREKSLHAQHIKQMKEAFIEK